MCSFAAGRAVGKRARPQSGNAEHGRGGERRYMPIYIKCMQTTAAAQKSTYPGVAQLVARLLWECRGGIRDEAGRNAAKPCDTGDSRFFPVAESGTKAALTTGMTTDRKIFDFLPRRGIMVKIEYPGIAKLVSRLVWDQETVRSSRTTRTKIPLKSTISEGFFLFFVYCGAEFE